MPSFQNRQGNLFLGLMVLILITSILAMRMIPEYNTISEREDEQEFTVTLGQIRSAMKLERSLNDPKNGLTSPCAATYNALINDINNPAKVEAYLKDLYDNKFLINYNPKDPTIKSHLWGTGASQLFWQARRNLVASTTSYGIGSFEAGTEVIDGFNSPAGWINTFPDNDNATFSPITPSSEDSNLDFFIGQNKLGSPISDDGYCLKLATSTP